MILASLFHFQHPGILALLGVALLLGTIHGVTPDEHTWPITFSYAIGSYSTKGGLRAGLFFSLGFTIQRAIFSELAYFALTKSLHSPHAEAAVYIAVGILMAISGLIMRTRGSPVHLFPFVEKLLPPLDPTRQPPPWLASLHGLIAGLGTGPFATILYTTISPAMSGPAIAWLPGALFGSGTLIAQVAIGALFGRAMERRGMSLDQRSFVGRTIASFTLGIGGLVFISSAIFSLAFPNLANFAVSTGINVPNLDSINLGLVMVIVIVPIVGGASTLYAMKKVKSSPMVTGGQDLELGHNL